jgi:hypothetical protein
MTERTKKAARIPADAPGVIVLGLDEAGKPRAARFAASQAALAEKAAKLMDLMACAITPELADLAKKLPGGRIYANGKGFVPVVRRKLFDQIVQAAGITEPRFLSSAPTPELPPATIALSWDDIDVGKLVLAEFAPAEGWWEAVVIERAGDALTLRWRDWPKEPAFVRERLALALLNPGAIP